MSWAFSACHPRDDFVLHVEEIGQGLIEPLGPEMTARLGVDELHVDAHAVSAALDAALEDIADIQLAPDRLYVERLAFLYVNAMLRAITTAP